VYGTIQVTLLSKVYQAPESFTEEESSILSEYVIIREFEIRNNCQSSRKIHHIQYREWHDFGVPDNPLGALNLILLANTTQVEYENSQAEVGPMIVHCSAGCGRTGAFCTIDTIVSRLSHIDQASDESLDLVYQTVAKFREQRVSMVQTLRQYVFCYEAILWWMLAQS
jgi:protein tyrosine phosphatase